MSESSGSLLDIVIPAPGRVYRGFNILQNVPLTFLGSRVLVIGGSRSLAQAAPALTLNLVQHQATAEWTAYGADCSERELARMLALGQTHRVTGVIGVGGGKPLDVAKWVAQSLACPILTVPTSAATCAAWTALTNIYSDEGAFQRDVSLKQAPTALILDYQLIQTAPARTLVAGIGDALAKWYEASVSSGASEDALVIAAVQQARVLRDLLMQDSLPALQNPGSQVWQRVVDACIVLAGVVGGLGGAKCRTVAAHAVHNGLTHLLRHRASWHGEKVAFGILVQLRLDEILQNNQLAVAARRQLLPFYQQIGLPQTLADLGLGELSSGELRMVAQIACAPASDIHHLPFAVSPEALMVALTTPCVGISQGSLQSSSVG
ncbi:MAG: iron-containing alcohol dehydrogenase [Cyanobacteriota bacterium]|nr:iron-containing alcohol dehydrogenase [Cyanobacteriota bacterium]